MSWLTHRGHRGATTGRLSMGRPADGTALPLEPTGQPAAFPLRADRTSDPSALAPLRPRRASRRLVLAGNGPS